MKVHVYTLSGNALHDKTTLDHSGAITDIKYSPDGAYVAVCDTYRKVLLYQLPDYTVLFWWIWRRTLSDTKDDSIAFCIIFFIEK